MQWDMNVCLCAEWGQSIELDAQMGEREAAFFPEICAWFPGGCWVDFVNGV